MSQVDDCIKVISKSAKGFRPQVGLILGSGLGQFCEHVDVVASIDFDELRLTKRYCDHYNEIRRCQKGSN